MSRLATSFVLGYHGCEREIARAAVAGEISLNHSNKDYDWLGPGSYFWESDPQRAWEWATECVGRKAYREPCVIGAVIDLRNCLDLLNRSDQDLLALAHNQLAAIYEAADKKMPANESSKRGGDNDRLLRKLDCAVIRHLHAIIEDLDDAEFPPFDSVRGMFTEGGAIYPGSAFHQQSHVQVAILNNDCIRGYFYPPELAGYWGA
ncbi:hypothetical protein [Sphingobium yanoikuyae]|uniref:hypothetical protein n=1 Tax=Sphingobium yanoikuyae TaxID=13690 RepID=UPI0031D7AD7A